MSVVQLLYTHGFLNDQQWTTLKTTAAQNQTDVLKYLTANKIVPAETVAKAKAQVLGFPYADLREKEFPADILNIITRSVAENYQVVPWARQGNDVSIGLIDPHNYAAIEALDFIAHSYKIRFIYYLISEDSLLFVLKQYDNVKTEVAHALEQQSESDEEMLVDTEKPENDPTRNTKNAPISKTVSVILRHAVEGAASDVHIEPDEQGTRVRYRLDGVLHTSLQLPKGVHNALVARIKVLSNLKLDETRLPQDGRFRMHIDDHDVDFRVSTMPLVGKEKVVIRILDTESGIQKLEDLGYADHNLEIIHRNLKRPHGMILITGPTGSGKSTTLYSMLKVLNSEKQNIITLEDPVEYNMSGIAQTQIRPEIGLTFVRGLRAVLRQDPDIIMVGEIRDNETAELGIHAALTGHMLLSTLHTNNAIGAIPRLIDMEIEPFLIASSLNLVIAQRLARRICTECRKPISLSSTVEQEVRQILAEIPKTYLPTDIAAGLTNNQPFTVYQGAGCPHCEDSGYKGRVAVAEVIEVTENLGEIIGSGKASNMSVMAQEMLSQGMISLKQDAIIKALRGYTTVEEALSVARE
ncbi:MAG: hypothetical protein A2233_02075 [Candidatus Kerfeldbacteria bacterium RIFOXYA2_FULL_38_24]|uniref:Bacterial type II secretion system protein E domain-containing protein n=1 Tax=Candidatus Kerfeldbacteria bacterium RIFOXYB2_FULL_38_14 TaxID=1798547 RepID=A0A1G2BGY0_9BACT|nr:MAG: hypothetical protein A2319_04675 [Candidatus Kerfeldbacteria bacterium RIFOXYB2_FULL_38_14]OGY87962.1 MAG: hypothetical protein A2233_02075 [Candidatus Kerfeldbacteria bacterium RIFOXYA2_FULL_38_24]OGY88706.1 MAG: hypothetical protein A2458_03530 [Candidatus Kerfeldbacteria bacterium RIFOXYC2_FULL_38_9]